MVQPFYEAISSDSSKSIRLTALPRGDMLIYPGDMIQHRELQPEHARNHVLGLRQHHWGRLFARDQVPRLDFLQCQERDVHR